MHGTHHGLNLQDIPGLSRIFSHFFQDFLHQSFRTFQNIWRKPRTFHDFYGVVRIATIKFIPCKNKKNASCSMYK